MLPGPLFVLAASTLALGAALPLTNSDKGTPPQATKEPETINVENLQSEQSKILLEPQQAVLNPLPKPTSPVQLPSINELFRTGILTDPTTGAGQTNERHLPAVQSYRKPDKNFFFGPEPVIFGLPTAPASSKSPNVPQGPKGSPLLRPGNDVGPVRRQRQRSPALRTRRKKDEETGPDSLTFSITHENQQDPFAVMTQFFVQHQQMLESERETKEWDRKLLDLLKWQNKYCTVTGNTWEALLPLRYCAILPATAYRRLMARPTQCHRRHEEDALELANFPETDDKVYCYVESSLLPERIKNATWIMWRRPQTRRQ